MSTKEDLIAFFHANGIYCEQLDNKLLIVYKNRNLLISKLGTTRVRYFFIEIPITAKSKEEFKYASVEELKCNVKNLHTVTYSERFKNNEDKSLAETDLLEILEKIISTDYIRQTCKGIETVDKIFKESKNREEEPFTDLFKTLTSFSKDSLLSLSKLLNGIAESIHSEDDSANK